MPSKAAACVRLPLDMVTAILICSAFRCSSFSRQLFIFSSFARFNTVFPACCNRKH